MWCLSVILHEDVPNKQTSELGSIFNIKESVIKRAFYGLNLWNLLVKTIKQIQIIGVCLY